LRALLAAALAALAAGGCGSDSPPAAPSPRGGGEATVATVGACLAKAGARPVTTAAELEFAAQADAGAVGAGLDGRTTYEFKPRDAGGGDWRVFRTRSSDRPAPAHADDPPQQGEEVAVLAPPAAADAVRRAQGCADGAPE
jgi:hypothetical protein